jgi:hypothetical protein
MEYEITGRKEIIGTKSTLVSIAVTSVLVCAISAILRSFLIDNGQDYSSQMVALLSVTTILGLIVSVMAFHTRLQVGFDESEAANQAALETQQI